MDVVRQVTIISRLLLSHVLLISIFHDFNLCAGSGESQSLMKGLAHAVSTDEMGLGTLKLMVLYKNVERMLADALGATDGITVIYNHNSLSYKYRGRLRVQNILDSVHYVMSLSPDEHHLKSLTTAEELREFLHSTDKAVLLFEFCGWTPSLVAMNNSMTGSDIGVFCFYPTLFFVLYLPYFPNTMGGYFFNLLQRLGNSQSSLYNDVSCV